MLKTVVLFICLLVLGLTTGAHAQSAATAQPSAKRVTVTLVRWPYT